jgi:hypothetical protein
MPNPLTVQQTIELMDEVSPLGIFESVKKILEYINPSMLERKELSVIEAIEEVLKYRMMFFPRIGFGSSDGVEVYPHMFFWEKNKIGGKVVVAGRGREVGVSLNRAIEAEKLALAQNRYAFLYLYLVVAGGKGNIFSDIQELLSTPNDERLQAQLEAFFDAFSQQGAIRLLPNAEFRDEKSKKTRRRISLIANPSLSGGVAYAIPFQDYITISFG